VNVGIHSCGVRVSSIKDWNSGSGLSRCCYCILFCFLCFCKSRENDSDEERVSHSCVCVCCSVGGGIVHNDE